MLEPNSFTREYELKRKQLRIDLAACAFIVAVLVFVFWFSGGCSEMYFKGGGNTHQATAIEQVLTWNAALADANLGIAKGIIAANEAGEIDVPTSNAILTQQSLIADADRQLTPTLAKACSAQKQIQACNAAILSGDAQTIQTLVDQIRDSASRFKTGGTAGIRNATRKQTIDKGIEDINTLVEKMIGGLQQLGVLKTKMTVWGCGIDAHGMAVSYRSAQCTGAQTVTMIYGTGKACTLDGPLVCLAEVKP